jgi:hypothetical protein
MNTSRHSSATTTFSRKDRDAHTNHEHKTANERSTKEQRYLFLLQQKEQQKKLSDLKHQLREQKLLLKNPRRKEKRDRDRELGVWAQAQAKSQGQAYHQEIADEEADHEADQEMDQETCQEPDQHRCVQHLDFGLPFTFP